MSKWDEVFSLREMQWRDKVMQGSLGRCNSKQRGSKIDSPEGNRYSCERHRRIRKEAG